LPGWFFLHNALLLPLAIDTPVIQSEKTQVLETWMRLQKLPAYVEYIILMILWKALGKLVVTLWWDNSVGYYSYSTYHTRLVLQV
jgi:hypothetical protein